MVEEIARHPASSVSPIQEIDGLWINAGLNCDGDTIAMTAATQPSVEDLVLGNLPWIPRETLLHLLQMAEQGAVRAGAPPRP
jgi:hydrogenase small subunit